MGVWLQYFSMRATKLNGIRLKAEGKNRRCRRMRRWEKAKKEKLWCQPFYHLSSVFCALLSVLRLQP
jgi:hypothetical protein